MVEDTENIKRRELINQFRNDLNKRKYQFLNQESLEIFLNFIKENGWFYKIILKNRQDFPIAEGMEDLYNLLITPIKIKHPQLDSEELMYYFVAFQSSFTAILKRWAIDDYRTASSQIALIIINSLPKIIAASLA